MSTDIRDITDTVEEVAFGAAETAAEVASNPIASVRRQVKSLERRGTPAARKINRRVNARIDAATEPARDAFKVISRTAAKYPPTPSATASSRTTKSYDRPRRGGGVSSELSGSAGAAEAGFGSVETPREPNSACAVATIDADATVGRASAEPKCRFRQMT